MRVEGVLRENMTADTERESQAPDFPEDILAKQYNFFHFKP